MNTIHFESSDNPFSPDIKIPKLYSNQLIDQFFSVLINSIDGKDFLVLVIGEPKSGKTTLLTKLTNEIEQKIKSCQLKFKKNNETISKNNMHPIFLFSTEESQVIIMDNAHDLNHHELSIILKDAWGINKKITQLILFCEPRINGMIASLLKEMPKKTSVNKLYIPCFDKKQTESYLMHYLITSNISDRFSFSRSNIRNIYKKSKGLPGIINQEAERIFLKNMPRLNTKQTKFKFNPVLTFAISIVITLTGALFLQKSDTTISDQPLKTITKNILPPETIDPIKFPQAVDIKLQTKQSTIIETPIQEPAQTVVNTPIPKPIIAKAPITKPPTPNPIIAKPIIERPQLIYQEKWIMTQEPLLFTIQVMAAQDKDSINRFLKLNKNNQNKSAYYKMYSKKEIWYKFISGKYETHEEAKTACQNLPEKLKKLGPWPRQFASIQNDIDDFIKIKDTN